MFLEAERKYKLLRSVAGGRVEQLVELRTRWDKFEIMMESHQLVIKDQVGRGGEEGRGVVMEEPYTISYRGCLLYVFEFQPESL